MEACPFCGMQWVHVKQGSYLEGADNVQHPLSQLLALFQGHVRTCYDCTARTVIMKFEPG